MKAGAEALGFPAYQSLVIGIVLAVCVVVTPSPHRGAGRPRHHRLPRRGCDGQHAGRGALLTHTLFAVLFGVVMDRAGAPAPGASQGRGPDRRWGRR